MMVSCARYIGRCFRLRAECSPLSGPLHRPFSFLFLCILDILLYVCVVCLWEGVACYGMQCGDQRQHCGADSYLWVPGLKLRLSALVIDILARRVILLALQECFQSLIFNTLHLSLAHVTTAAEAHTLLLHKKGGPVRSQYLVSTRPFV